MSESYGGCEAGHVEFQRHIIDLEDEIVERDATIERLGDEIKRLHSCLEFERRLNDQSTSYCQRLLARVEELKRENARLWDAALPPPPTSITLPPVLPRTLTPVPRSPGIHAQPYPPPPLACPTCQGTYHENEYFVTHEADCTYWDGGK